MTSTSERFPDELAIADYIRAWEERKRVLHRKPIYKLREAWAEAADERAKETGLGIIGRPSELYALIDSILDLEFPYLHEARELRAASYEAAGELA